jgi:alpha-glucosidase
LVIPYFSIKKGVEMHYSKPAVEFVQVAFGILFFIIAPSLAMQSQEQPATANPRTSDIIRIDPPDQGFYAKKIDCLGIWIKAPDVVADEALLEAHRRISQQIGRNKGIRHNLTEVGAELHIIGKDQVTSDLPENRHWKGKLYEGNLTIDQRTRGIGGRVASCGEENLLKLDKDRYRGRDICSHEFAHTILNFAADPAMRKRVEEQFKASTSEGKWKRAYGGSNYNEYFAELTMWYVGTRGHWAKGTGPEPGIGPEWLKTYDPAGYEMVDGIYSGRRPVEETIRTSLQAIAPDREETIQSTPDMKDRADRTSILFDNQSSEEIQLFALDQEGKRQTPRSLAPGCKDMVRTFAGQAWLVADKIGKTLGIYIAEKAPGKVILR